MKTDALLYRLLQDHPSLVFELAGLPVPETDYELRAEEIKETKFRFDGILIPSIVSAESPVVFLENQFQPDDDFYARWFASIFLYLRQHPEHRWWRAVALFPELDTDAGQTRGFEELLSGTRTTRVYLDKWTAQQPESPALGLIQLLLAEPAEAIAKARNLMAAPIPAWPDFKTWVETFLVYKLPRLTREEIKAMVHLIDVDLKDTRYFQDVATEMQANLLIRQLRKKLGTLAPAQEIEVRALALRSLADLGEALLDFARPDDLTHWLDQNTKH